MLPSRVGEGRHGRRARAGQAEIDTPDGKPNAEWLTVRHNKLFRQPLEATEELGSKLSNSFNEAPPPPPAAAPLLKPCARPAARPAPPDGASD